MSFIKIAAIADQTLVGVVVQTVQKGAKQYIDEHQAEFLITSGKVFVDDWERRDVGLVLEPAIYCLKINDRLYTVRVIAPEKE